MESRNADHQRHDELLLTCGCRFCKRILKLTTTKSWKFKSGYNLIELNDFRQQSVSFTTDQTNIW